MANRVDKLSVLRPLERPRKLHQQIAERLADDISSGKLRPGARLPTEQKLVAAMGVSRTVIREAVAALRAEGLIVTRQGLGAFVAPVEVRRPFRLAAEGLPSLELVLDVMELRAAVETESAFLAATRGSKSDRHRIGKALSAIDSAIRRHRSAIDEDFAFHVAIAHATGNSQILHLLEYLGRFIIPRQSIRVSAHTGEGQRAYLERIQQEHYSIFDAIRSGDAQGARDAMKRHLDNSQRRYRQLADTERGMTRHGTRRVSAPPP